MPVLAPSDHGANVLRLAPSDNIYLLDSGTFLWITRHNSTVEIEYLISKEYDRMGLKMLLESLGINLDEVMKMKDLILGYGNTMVENQTIEKIIALPETLERIEKKLDMLLERK